MLPPCQPPIATLREVAFDEELERVAIPLNEARLKNIITAYTVHPSGNDSDYIEGAIFFSIRAADSACELELMLKHLAASVEHWRKGSDKR